jgi:hypothetical protein
MLIVNIFYKTYSMTIHQIKELTKDSSPYFFKGDTMRFFGQTMKSFSVKKQPDGRYKISAPMKDQNRKVMGQTVRYFDPIKKTLELK